MRRYMVEALGHIQRKRNRRLNKRRREAHRDDVKKTVKKTVRSRACRQETQSTRGGCFTGQLGNHPSLLVPSCAVIPNLPHTRVGTSHPAVQHLIVYPPSFIPFSSSPSHTTGSYIIIYLYTADIFVSNCFETNCFETERKERENCRSWLSRITFRDTGVRD